MATLLRLLLQDDIFRYGENLAEGDVNTFGCCAAFSEISRRWRLHGNSIILPDDDARFDSKSSPDFTCFFAGLLNSPRNSCQLPIPKWVEAHTLDVAEDLN